MQCNRHDINRHHFLISSGTNNRIIINILKIKYFSDYSIATIYSMTYIDRAKPIVTKNPQKLTITACFIEEESSGGRPA